MNGQIIETNDAIAKLNERLSILIKRGESIEVKDAGTCLEAKQYKVEVDSFIKAVDLYADGDIQEAKEKLTRLQTAKKMLFAPVQSVLDLVQRKRKQWEEDERRKAEMEQRRLQEEARIAAEKKAAEERREREKQAAEERKKREKEIEEARKAGDLKKREADRLAREAREAEERERQRAEEDARKTAAEVPVVEVKAAIPTLAGTASRRDWKFKVVDATRIPRGFLVPDMTEIGRMVRDAKDKAKAEAECPGIEVWSE